MKICTAIESICVLSLLGGGGYAYWQKYEENNKLSTEREELIAFARDMSKKVENTVRLLGDAQTDLSKSKAECAKTCDERDAIKARAESTERLLGNTRSDLNKLQNECELVRGERKTLKAQAKKLEEDIASQKAAVAAKDEKLKDSDKKIGEVKRQLELTNKENSKLVQEKKSMQVRVNQLENKIAQLRLDAEKSEYKPMVEAIRLGNALCESALKPAKMTTDLAKDTAKKEYKDLVEKLKGRRVVFCGKVVNIDKRIVSFSQYYLTLNVADGFNVKIIFEKDAEKDLIAMKAGDEVTFGAYVVSTGDLNHELTVAGPVRVAPEKYSKALSLSAE